jgi:hypothetical protein
MAATLDVKTHFQHGLRAARITLASSVAMLLPFLAAADSQLQLGMATTSLRATARVKFKIVIPAVLSLDAPRDAATVPQTVAVFSNNRSVALAATFGSSEDARKTVLINSAARKVIAQQVACAPGSDPAAAPAPIGRRPVASNVGGGVVCTACMP